MSEPTAGKNRGKVFLIGAGPGDPDLLTLKAVKALAQCDVLLVDELVNPAVLQHARAGARIIPVGKRGGCKSTPQAFIERMMLRFARAGAIVGRVKGGDPFVFGRGGEEMLTLRRAGVALDIIPGITAGCAVPSALQIPVTHRDFSRGVTFVTGHSKNDAPLNYAALANSDTTLVIYMGVANLGPITAAPRRPPASSRTARATISAISFQPWAASSPKRTRQKSAARPSSLSAKWCHWQTRNACRCSLPRRQHDGRSDGRRQTQARRGRQWHGRHQDA